MASAALTPDLALRHLGELSTDIRAAVLLAPDGSLAASEPDDGELGEALCAEAASLLDAADRAAEASVGEVEAPSSASGTAAGSSRCWPGGMRCPR